MDKTSGGIMGFTVTGLTVLRGVDAVELIGWGGDMLSDDALRALILVPRMSMLIIDSETFNVGIGETDIYSGLSTKLHIIEEPRNPHRRLLGVRSSEFKHLSVVCAIQSGGKRGLRYAGFYLGCFPCGLGNHGKLEDALSAMQRYTSLL